jgi:hypothetical protein
MIGDFWQNVPQGSSVYFLFKDESCVYIGQSRRTIKRIYQHAKTGTFDSARFLEVKDDAELSDRESFFIRSLKPTLNRNGRGESTAPAINAALDAVSRLPEFKLGLLNPDKPRFHSPAWLEFSCPSCHAIPHRRCTILGLFACPERIALVPAKIKHLPTREKDPREGLWSVQCRRGLCSECNGYRAGRKHGMRLKCQHPYHRKAAKP